MGTDRDIETRVFPNHKERQLIFVRECNFEDLEIVKEINEKELPEDYPFFFYKSILDNFKEAFLVACLKDNPKKIIGYIMWRVEKTPSKHNLRLINKGHLVSIAVSEMYRREGVASALLSKSMHALTHHKLKDYVLEVRVTNYGAIELYKKFGYKTQGIKKKYYKDGENAYFMVYTLEDDD